jgi:hypothetical protein
MPQSLSDDTTADIEQRQIQAWRRMTPAEKLSLAMSLTATARQLALAGVRQRYPNASPREAFLRLAIVTLGLDERGQRIGRARHPLDDRGLDCQLNRRRASTHRWRRRCRYRSRNDILGIIRVQGWRLDRDYLLGNAPILGVSDLLNRALDEA